MAAAAAAAAADTARTPLRWSDAFLLGTPRMDATHREFVACVAALQSAPDAELRARLDEFERHAVEHFSQEGEWMDSTAFPAAQCHADEHAAVLASVREVRGLIDRGADVALVRQLADALADWFPGHADYMDAALSHWLSQRSHGGAPVVLRRAVSSPLPPAAPSSHQDKQ